MHGGVRLCEWFLGVLDCNVPGTAETHASKLLFKHRGRVRFSVVWGHSEVVVANCKGVFMFAELKEKGADVEVGMDDRTGDSLQAAKLTLRKEDVGRKISFD